MKRTGLILIMALLLLPCAACNGQDSGTIGGISQSDADALNDAAEKLDQQQESSELRPTTQK